MPCSTQPMGPQATPQWGPCTWPVRGAGFGAGQPMGSALPSWKMAFETARHFLKGFSGESPRGAVPVAGAAAPPAASIKRGAGSGRQQQAQAGRHGDVEPWATGWSTTGFRPRSS